MKDMKYIEIFWVFLKLGCTSFGGPIAHLVYFRRAFVERRAWVGEQEYSNIIALCQTLPGPASSQVGFTLGLIRGGLPGALLAFIGFTLPSVVLLLLFANYLSLFDSQIGTAALQGLAILALAVVLHGVLAMGKNLCFDKTRFSIALLTFIIMLMAQTALAQVSVIILGALLGSLFIQKDKAHSLTLGEQPNLNVINVRPNAWLSVVLSITVLGLFFVLPLFSEAASKFYRSGALVFGGGHVVLPLLETAFVASGDISQSDFLAGYGATQAIPGPMFTFAAYLGFLQAEYGGIFGAMLATVCIFLPSFLLILAFYPFWKKISANVKLQSAIAGTNAAVVGLLAAALYDPIFIHAVTQPSDLALAAAAYSALARFNAPVLGVVFACVVLKILLTLSSL